MAARDPRRERIEEAMSRVQTRIMPRAIPIVRNARCCVNETDCYHDQADPGTRRALHKIWRDEQQQLEHAKGRLEQGLYGVCEECKQPIEPERLRWIVGATRCSGCESLLDKGQQHRLAPLGSTTVAATEIQQPGQR